MKPKELEEMGLNTFKSGPKTFELHFASETFVLEGRKEVHSLHYVTNLER